MDEFVFLYRRALILNKENKSLSSGQVLIEFLFTFTFSLGIFFIFIMLALHLSSGLYAHYGTFMAARTYLVFDQGNDIENSDSASKDQANLVFNSFDMRRYGIQEQIRFNDPGQTGSSDFIGVYLNFKKRFSFFFAGSGAVETNLVSEAFLGRETLRVECLERIEFVMGSLGVGQGIPADHKTLFDNGC